MRLQSVMSQPLTMPLGKCCDKFLSWDFVFLEKVLKVTFRCGEGSRVIYEVQLRRCLDGGPTEWYAAAKVIKIRVTVDGLKPGQLYEVRVRN